MVFKVSLILILISSCLSFLYLIQFCVQKCLGRSSKYHMSHMTQPEVHSHSQSQCLPDRHVHCRPKSEDQITHIEEILDNPGPR